MGSRNPHQSQEYGHKKQSVFARMFGDPGVREAPSPPDLSRPLDGQVDDFWDWLRAGCPYRGTPTGEMRDVIEACTSSHVVRLGALAGHPSEWVRLGVAGNPHTPMWALWGDGMLAFGLVEDESVWVSASVMVRHFKPPIEVVESLKASRRMSLVGAAA